MALYKFRIIIIIIIINVIKTEAFKSNTSLLKLILMLLNSYLSKVRQ